MQVADHSPSVGELRRELGAGGGGQAVGGQLALRITEVCPVWSFTQGGDRLMILVANAEFLHHAGKQPAAGPTPPPPAGRSRCTWAPMSTTQTLVHDTCS